MKPLTEEGQRLASEAVDRAGRIAQRYARIFPKNAADFASAAHLGAMRAAASWSPDGGRVWERWSNLCVTSEVKSLLRSLSRPEKIDLWPQEDLDSIPDTGGVPGGPDPAERLEALLGLLPPRLRELCELVYKDGMSPYAAGQALGHSGQNGCNIHQRALAYLRERLAAHPTASTITREGDDDARQ